VSNEIVTGDNGTTIRLTITDDKGIVDIRSSTVDVLIKYKNRSITKQATVTNGELGQCEVMLNSSDVSVEGIYTFQCTVKFIDGKQFSSDIQRFVVSKKL
jgi:hypothetical protein